MPETFHAADLVTFWDDEIRAGKEYRKKFAHPEKWEDYKDYYRGEWKNGDEIPVNKIFSLGRTMIPRTYFRAPMVSVTPTRPSLEWQARIVEHVDNYLIRELLLKKVLKRSILDAYTCGTSPIKLGFDSQYGYLSKHTTLPAGESVTQMSDKFENRRIEYRTNIKPGMPWACATPPVDVITPWGVRDPEDFPWVAHEYLRPLRDVQQDAKYDAARKRLKGGWVRSADDPKTDAGHYFMNRGRVSLCLIKEIRDRRNGTVVVLCEGEVLIEEEDPLQIEGLPWEFLTFNDDPDYFWGLPDVKMVEAQALELNQTRTQEMRHRRIAMLKLLYKKGLLKEDQIKKFLSEDIEMIEVEMTDDDFLENVVMQMQNHIPPDLRNAAMAQLADIRETLGFSRNESGEFQTGTPPSAHEVVAVQGGADIRSDERRDCVADVLTNIIRKWNQYIFKFWDTERVAKVVGPDGAQYWLKYTGEELAGEYDLNVDPDSGMPVNRQVRMQQAQALFGQLKMDPFMNPIKVRELYLHQHAWIDPSWEGVIQNPAAMAQLMAGQAGEQKPGSNPAGRSDNGAKVNGAPSQPMSVEQARKGGA